MADRSVSSDCHTGCNHVQYREYLDPQWREGFDAWRGRYANPFRDLQGDGRTRNWDSERRLADMHGEGVVGEVIFPNTVPPFFPTGSVIAPPPSPEDYECRLTGIRAHKRWLADFCSDFPEQRAGQAQICCRVRHRTRRGSNRSSRVPTIRSGRSIRSWTYRFPTMPVAQASRVPRTRPTRCSCS